MLDMLQAGPRPTIARFKVYQRDRFRCCLCGASAITDMTVMLHVDHIIPVSRGGTKHPDNLCALCDGCNVAKGSRLLEDDTLAELQAEIRRRNISIGVIDPTIEYDPTYTVVSQ